MTFIQTDRDTQTDTDALAYLLDWRLEAVEEVNAGQSIGHRVFVEFDTGERRGVCVCVCVCERDSRIMTDRQKIERDIYTDRQRRGDENTWMRISWRVVLG